MKLKSNFTDTAFPIRSFRYRLCYVFFWELWALLGLEVAVEPARQLVGILSKYTEWADGKHGTLYPAGNVTINLGYSIGRMDVTYGRPCLCPLPVVQVSISSE